MFKKCPVVMLSTNEKAVFYLDNIIGLIFSPKDRTIPGLKYQQLYIVSDEEIKKGDWAMHGHSMKIVQVEQIISIGPELHNCEEELKLLYKGGSQDLYPFKKIIATTNENLGLPQPSQEFLELYCKRYNKGTLIMDVMVEYEQWTVFHGEHNNTPTKTTLKVNPDNTINIKPIKDSWSREEVNQEKEEFIHLFFSKHYNKLSNINFTSQYIREWCKENL